MKTIEVIQCDLCPYNSGWDFTEDCITGNDLDNNLIVDTEALFCAHERMTNMVGDDKVVGCFNRPKVHSGEVKIPFPEWCPLEDKILKRRLDV